MTASYPPPTGTMLMWAIGVLFSVALWVLAFAGALSVKDCVVAMLATP